MRESIGVLSWRPWRMLNAASLKRDALIFRRLTAADIYEGIRELVDSGSERRKFLASNLEWLLTNGILYELDDICFEKFGRRILGGLGAQTLGRRDDWESVVVNLGKAANHIEQGKISGIYQGLERLIEAHEYVTRIISYELSAHENTDAYPIISRRLALPENVEAKKADVFHIVLEKIPAPDDSVPWEQIVEFRNDPENESKLLALRCWISDVARGDLTQSEIEDRIIYLTDQYQKYMNINKMKTNVGILETVVIGTAGVAEDLLEFKWKKIANSLFSIKHRRVALMEAELSAPGRELAIIAKTTEEFGPKDQ